MLVGKRLKEILPTDAPVVAHVGLLGLGTNKTDICKQVLSGLPETCLIPTFSYSYTAKEEYHRRLTPCRAGAFGEWIRHHWVRTADPLFSFAVRGDVPSRFLVIGDVDCFGPLSVWDWLLKQDGYVAFLGTDIESCTLIHHIEWLALVDYRHTVEFPGVTEGVPTVARYFCRKKNKGLVTSLDRLGKALRMEGHDLGGWRVAVAKARQIKEAAMELLAQDPYALVTQEVPCLTTPS